MKETTILIPTTNNQGTTYPASTWERLEQRLTEVAGGYTLLGETRGKWIDHHGREYTDACRMYAVTNVSKDELAQLVDWVKDVFGQQAIYVRHAAAQIL